MLCKLKPDLESWNRLTSRSWAMTLSLFYFSLWLIMRGSNFVRPTALQRGFVNIWLFALGWGIQVLAAVAEDRMHIAALYSSLFLQSAVFLSTLISLLEQFGLLRKNEFAQQQHDAHHARDHPEYRDLAHSGDGEQGGADDDSDSLTDEPTERTPLRVGEQGYGANTQPSFADTYRRSVSENTPNLPDNDSHPPYEFEQSWSGRLPD